MSERDTAPGKRRLRWGPVALAVSLAFNLLFVGLVGGTALNRARDDRHRPPERGELLNYGPYTSALTTEDRLELRQALIGEAGVLREIRREVRRDFNRLLDALRAQPYDPEAANAILEMQQARVQRQIKLVSVVLLEHLAGMSDAERLAFADRLEKVLRRGPPRPEPRRD